MRIPLLRTIPVMLILLACAFPVTGQQTAGPYKDSRTIPDTPAYKRAAEIVDLINGGDAAVIEDWVRRNFTPQMLGGDVRGHVEFLGSVRGFNGVLEIVSARSYDPPRPPNSAMLIVRGKVSEAWRGIAVDVEEAPPHRVVGFMVNPARPPSDLPAATRLTDDRIAAELSAYIDRLAAQDAYSGTVLLAKDGKILMTKAVGIANRDFDAKVTLDTKFNVGSMNKMMTGVACMQLVERGKLSLEDPVSKHLGDDWLPKVDKTKVKLKHLLTHTSGLGSYFTEEWDRSSRGLYRDIADWKPIVEDDTLAFEPGTQSQYSNTGMLVAGAIIEKVSGVDYYRYVRDNITGPAGMTSTDFYETDLANRNLAVGYEKESAPEGTIWRNNLYLHVVRGGPAGGGYSTVGDLLRFDQALRGGKLVKRASLEQLWRAYPEISSPDYGLGFGIVEGGAIGKVVGHSGGFPGISAVLTMFLDTGYTLAALANQGGVAELVEGKARELIGQGRS